MEVESSSKPSLGGPSSSFRLRSPSLNCLRLRRIFDVFHANGDGMITLEELRQALEQLGMEADQSELESTVLCYVKPGNTGLEYEDFETLHLSLGHRFFGSEDDLSDPAAQEEADLAEAFKVFDEDGDGYISAAELQVVLDKLGLPEAQEMDRVQQMIISVDQNQDGRVDFSEFKNMMQNVTIRSTAA